VPQPKVASGFEELRPKPARHVSPLLATAIVAFPILFIWLLLQRGYAGSTRRAAFTFFAATALPYVLVMLFAMMGLV
jgi:hypothetical protein